MTDLTLQDLVAEGGSEAAGGAAEAASEAASEAAEAAGKGRGEWLVDLYQQMSSDGTLEMLLFGPENAGGGGSAPNQPRQKPQNPEMFGNTDADESAEQGGENGESGGIENVETVDDLDAEAIADICRVIEANAGDLTVSQIRFACENTPGRVNSILEDQL